MLRIVRREKSGRKRYKKIKVVIVMQEAIRVEQLSKSYGSLLAVDNISLSVNTQAKIFLTGCPH